MEYSEGDFTLSEASSEMDQIYVYFQACKDLIDAYKRRYGRINEKISLLHSKKGLNLQMTTSLLEFQNQLIFHHLQYLRKQSQLVYNKLYGKTTSVADKLTFIYMSIDNLNGDINHEKGPIMKKLKRGATLKDVVDYVMECSDRIKGMLMRLKEYSSHINTEMEDGNYHCQTLTLDMRAKRMMIYVEYTKMQEYYRETVRFFNQLTTALHEQQNHSAVYKFLMHEEKEA